MRVRTTFRAEPATRVLGVVACRDTDGRLTGWDLASYKRSRTFASLELQPLTTTHARHQPAEGSPCSLRATTSPGETHDDDPEPLTLRQARVLLALEAADRRTVEREIIALAFALQSPAKRTATATRPRRPASATQPSGAPRPRRALVPDRAARDPRRPWLRPQPGASTIGSSRAAMTCARLGGMASRLGLSALSDTVGGWLAQLEASGRGQPRRDGDR